MKKLFVPLVPLVAAAALLLAGCATAPDRATRDDVRERANPVDAPRRTITNFTPALRCMDICLCTHADRSLQ